MVNMYSILKSLCADRGITITDMCRLSGVPRSSVGNLASGSTQQLSARNMQKIAAYFGVSVDYLLGNEQKEKPAPTDGDGFTEDERRDIALEVERMMADLENQGDLMFDGDPATPEALQTIRTAFEIGLTNARRINKEKHLKKE